MAESTSNHAYLFAEIVLASTFYVFSSSVVRWNEVLKCRFLLLAASLFVLWLFVDQLAVALRLWWFPPGGSLPWRFLSLPIEEYLLFILHTLVCFMVLEVVDKE